MCWSRKIPTHLDSPSEFVLAATFIPHTSYTLSRPAQYYDYKQVMQSLTQNIAAARPEWALQDVWQLACQGNQEQLLRVVPIAMLSETILNVHILARWFWWSIAVQVGWVLSEDEWWQACLDVAFMADYEASPFQDSLAAHQAEPAIQLPNLLALLSESIPACEQLGKFCIALVGQRDPFLHPHVSLWLARPPTHPMWSYACRDPAEACIVLGGFPKLPTPPR